MAIKEPFCRLPPPLQACFPPPTTTKKIKQPTCIFTVDHSRPTDELDTLSDSSLLPNSARLSPMPLPGDDYTKKKKKKKELCIVFELFCLVNNFMIWKRKKKEKKKKLLMVVVAGFEPGNYGLRNSRLTTELPKPTTTTSVTKYVLIFNMASRTIDLRPLQSHNSNFDLKNLIKCIYKVVNVSKLQYYEFRNQTVSIRDEFATWKIPKPEHNSRTPS